MSKAGDVRTVSTVRMPPAPDLHTHALAPNAFSRRTVRTSVLSVRPASRSDSVVIGVRRLDANTTKAACPIG